MTGGPFARLGAACRVRLGPAWRRLVGVLQQADPVRWALEPPRDPVRVAFASVYRPRNSGNVRALMEKLPTGAAVALWCLEGAPPADLASVTVGTGPGNRSALLNRLVAALPQDTDALVLADDDVRFVVGDLMRLVGAAQALSFDVYAPAHLASSHASWDFGRRRRFTYGRLTDFVEQGPLLGLSPAGREVVLPLPEDIGMSWGVETRWWLAARQRGARLGIVDATAVRHLVPAGTAYDRGLQEQTLRSELAAAGLSSLEQLHVVHERVGLRAAWRLRHRPEH